MGKLPAHGDFVRRGGPARVLAALDAWLDRELSRAPDLAERQEALDGWRFAVRVEGRDLLGAVAASGDSIGRLFPAVAVLETEGTIGFAAADSWCAAAGAALAHARDGHLRADAAASALAALDLPAIDGDDQAAGWWRDGDRGPAGGNDLPTGSAFAALFEARRA